MNALAWSSLVRIAELGKGPVERSLEADEATRERIARLLDLVSLKRLHADVAVAPWMDGAVVRGCWSARVEQTCGLSLEPFSTELDGRFEVRTVPSGSPLAPAPEAEVLLDPDAEDPPDVFEGGTIDIAAYVVEHLALELDPFPRAPGVSFEAPPAEPEPSPFGVLAQLKLRG